MPSSNLDPEELTKFAALAADWWDLNGKLQPLHAINPLRLGFIQQHINLKDKKVLDVGCGGGILTEAMAREGSQVLGIDLVEESLHVAQEHAKQNNVTLDYQQISVEELAMQQSASFDVVTCMEMLEHVPDPSSIIKSCSVLVKPGGYLFFSTINRNPKAYLFAIVGAEYILQLLEKGTHDYAKFIRPAELDQWAREAKLQLQQITGITYSPFSKEYKLARDVSVNYLTCYKA